MPQRRLRAPPSTDFMHWFKEKSPSIWISDVLPRDAYRVLDYGTFPGGMYIYRSRQSSDLFIKPEEAQNVLDDPQNASARKTLEGLQENLIAYWDWRNADPKQTHDIQAGRDARRSLIRRKGGIGDSSRDSQNSRSAIYSRYVPESTRSSIYYTYTEEQ